MAVAASDPLVGLYAQQVRILGERLAGLERDNTRLAADNDRLREENKRLRGRLEEARRAGKRQAAPFSRERMKVDPAKPGRKPGADYGTRARPAVPDPERVDEERDVGLPACCPDCDGDVVVDEVREQYQEELVPAHSRMSPL